MYAEVEIDEIIIIAGKNIYLHHALDGFLFISMEFTPLG